MIELRGRYLRVWKSNSGGPITSGVYDELPAGGQVGY